MADQEVLAERRAKLAKLRGEIFVQDRNITSAPELTLVDEFHETFSTADQQRHGGLNAEAPSQMEHKIFYAADSRGHQPAPEPVSSLDTNVLVAEAVRREHQKGSSGQRQENQSEDCLPTVDQLLVDGPEDLGYQSSLSSPSEATKRGKPAGGYMKDNSADPLSQSLPEGYLKAAKLDLTQSLGAIAEKAKSRGIYDPVRLFENGGTSERTPKDHVGHGEGGDDTEREYFRRMTKMQDRVRDSVVSRSKSFQHFLHQSFSGTGSGDGRRRSQMDKIAPDTETFTEGLDRRRPGRKSLPVHPVAGRAARPSGPVHPLSTGNAQLPPPLLTGDPSSPLECIDLGHQDHSQPGWPSAPLPGSPTLSCRTEFTEPDNRGRSRRRPAGGALLPFHIDAKHQSLKNGGDDWPCGEVCECCGQRKRAGWWAGLALLAIDIFTIVLILVLFHTIYPLDGVGLHDAKKSLSSDPNVHVEPVPRIQTGNVSGHAPQENLQKSHGNETTMEPVGHLNMNGSDGHLHETVTTQHPELADTAASTEIEIREHLENSLWSLDPAPTHEEDVLGKQDGSGIEEHSLGTTENPVEHAISTEHHGFSLEDHTLHVGESPATGADDTLTGGHSLDLAGGRDEGHLQAEGVNHNPSHPGEDSSTGPETVQPSWAVDIHQVGPKEEEITPASSTPYQDLESTPLLSGYPEDIKTLKPIQELVHHVQGQEAFVPNTEDQTNGHADVLSHDSHGSEYPTSVVPGLILDVRSPLKGVENHESVPEDQTSFIPVSIDDQKQTEQVFQAPGRDQRYDHLPGGQEGLGQDLSQSSRTADSLGPVIEALAERLANLTSELEDLKLKMTSGARPSFSCYKNTGLKVASLITYDNCSISTPGMDAKTGTFTVEEAGTYQLTFTGFFVALRGHMVSADLLVMRPTLSLPQILGRASAVVKEDTVFGRDDDLYSTASIILLEQLHLQDKVFVAMTVEGTLNESHLQSDFSKKIHFTAIKIS